MKYNYSDFVNIHKNIPALILGSSPNLSNFPFKKFKGKIFTLGDAIIRGENLFTADYWVAANSEFPIPNIPEHLEIINDFKKTKFFFSDTAAYDLLWKKSEKFLNDNLKVDWFCFDERHFNKKPCNPKKNCCKFLEENTDNITLQEYVAKHFNYIETPGKAGTVAEFAIAFAMLMGCNPLYIQGIELPEYRAEYVHYQSKKADDIHKKTKKLIKKKLFNYYIKKMIIHKILFKSFKNKFSEIKKYLLFDNDQYIIRDEKLGTKKISKNEKSLFFPSLAAIMKNLDIYFKIAQKNKIKIFYLSEKSNLNKLDGLSFLKPENIFH